MRTRPGSSYPLGATVYADGVNFCIFSRNCTAMELLLFDRYDSPVPSFAVRLDPRFNRTFYYWHIFIEGIGPGQLYGYRAYGPFEPHQGLRFDGSKVLVDPYARALMYEDNYQQEAARHPGDNCAHAMKSVVVDSRAYDWEGDSPLRSRIADPVIYEMHVRGFTRHPSSGVAPRRRGTYAGLIEKIPYLQDLGIKAVELMPVQQFDPQDAPYPMPNYWGYSPVSFFAPHRDYSSRRDALGPVDEFRDMVKALHRAGIEVILDVVFNHTNEGNHNGPTVSLRGLENRSYYILDPHNPALYQNYSGTGNSVNANHSVVRRLIMDCLRYWVTEMHVDGFRFDLASALSRDSQGHPLSSPPILWEIESDPVLAGTRIIAEAWDAAGLYQVDTVSGETGAVWNGRFRDDVRRFVKGDPGLVGNLTEYLSGTHRLRREPERDPRLSINFVTCHDGFTLYDLVSYNEKHNWANGEENRDGANDNHSWNCGVEGHTNDPGVLALRYRQMKNFLSLLLVCQGWPMILMGDEIRRTQHGNNNAYGQDNEINWFNWDDVAVHGDMVRFTRHMIHFHQELRIFRDQPQFWSAPGSPEITWHGINLYQPDWDHHSRSLAFELRHPAFAEHIYVALNAFWDSLDFALPPLPANRAWYRRVDTALISPDDFAEPPVLLPENTHRYRTQSRSVVILMAGDLSITRVD